MTRIVFLDAAEEEMLEAATFYEQQVPALGHRYLAAIKHTTSLIESNPQLGSPEQGNIRRLLVRRFPYALLYRTDPHEIIILAIMHLRRRPGYWKGRA